MYIGALPVPLQAQVVTDPPPYVPPETATAYFWQFEESGTNPTQFLDSLQGLALNNQAGGVTSVTGKIGKGAGIAEPYFLDMSFPLASSSVSWNGWVKFDQLPTDTPANIFEFAYLFVLADRSLIRYDLSAGWEFYLRPSNAVSYTVVRFPFTAVVGDWQMVTAWLDLTAQTLNISVNNGTPVSVPYLLAAPPMDQYTFRLGYTFPDNFYNLRGTVDLFGHITRVLTPAERTALYNGGAGKNSFP